MSNDITYLRVVSSPGNASTTLKRCLKVYPAAAQRKQKLNTQTVNGYHKQWCFVDSNRMVSISQRNLSFQGICRLNYMKLIWIMVGNT